MPGVAGLTRIQAALLGAAFLFLNQGCATPDSFGGSRAAVQEWGAARGFSASEAGSGAIRLLAMERGKILTDGDPLVIYIEGDGAAWPSPYHPPRDPTPLKPIALAMASADPSMAVAYLGRPCQYLDRESLQACPPDYWTARRFAPEILGAYEMALDQLKRGTGAQRLGLVGYSGGGVIAVLLAARRNDVDFVATVAAPLAVGQWTSWHGLSALAGSLDPASLSGNEKPPGLHFAGSEDKTVPSAIVGSYVGARGGRLIVIPGFDHECCWTRDWKDLLGRLALRENRK